MEFLRLLSKTQTCVVRWLSLLPPPQGPRSFAPLLHGAEPQAPLATQ